MYTTTQLFDKFWGEENFVVFINTIRAVVHVGVVQQMRQYAQESGRAGRDGEKSEAIIMWGYRMRGREKAFVRAEGGEVEGDMELFVEGKVCKEAFSAMVLLRMTGYVPTTYVT